MCDLASGKTRGRLTVAVHLHAQHAALVEDMQRCRGRSWFDAPAGNGSQGQGQGRVAVAPSDVDVERGRGDDDDRGEGEDDGAVSDDSLDGQADLTQRSLEDEPVPAAVPRAKEDVEESPAASTAARKVLYVSLDGTCSSSSASAGPAQFPTLGCAVTYRLPSALCDASESGREHVLWWDSISRALNSSRRHLFLPEPSATLTQEEKEDWIFAVYLADDPDLPTEPAPRKSDAPIVPAATATLTYPMWRSLLRAGHPDPAEIVLTAPLLRVDGNLPCGMLPDGLTLRLTHRIEPVLLSKTGLGQQNNEHPTQNDSVDLTHHAANDSGTVNYSVDLTHTTKNDCVDLTHNAVNDNGTVNDSVDLTRTTKNDSVDLTNDVSSDSADLTQITVNDSDLTCAAVNNSVSLDNQLVKAAAVNLTYDEPSVGSVNLTFLQLRCAGGQRWAADGSFFFAAVLLDRDDDFQVTYPDMSTLSFNIVRTQCIYVTVCRLLHRSSWVRPGPPHRTCAAVIPWTLTLSTVTLTWT